MEVIITPQNLVKENELQLTLIKTFEIRSFIMGYHVCNDIWSLLQNENLKVITETSNIEGKVVVPTNENDSLV